MTEIWTVIKMVENGVFPSKKAKNAQKSKHRPEIAKTHPKSFLKSPKKNFDFFLNFRFFKKNGRPP